MTHSLWQRAMLPASLVAVMGATLLAIPAQAQEPKPAEPPTPADTAKPAETGKPTVPPSVAKIDPEAKKIIDAMVTAHQALKSYSGKLDFSAKEGERAQTASTTLSFVRPNKVNLITTSSTTKGTRTVLSDGKQVYSTDSEDLKSYTRVEALPDERNIARAFSTISRGGGAGTGLFLILLTDPRAKDQVLGSSVASLELLPDTQVAGVDVKVVKAIIGLPPQPLIVTFSVGKEDSILRAVSIAPAKQDQPSQVTETYSEVKPNAPLADSSFMFTPPPGAKEQKVTEEPALYDQRLKVGASPLPLSGKDLTGKPVRLEDYKGKVVLIDFWATWCGPCVAEVPNVVTAYNTYKGKGFDVIGVSLDKAGDRPKLLTFTQSNKMPWRQIYDGKWWQSAVAEAYGVKAIPFTLLIGRDGKIAAVSPRGEGLAVAVKAALAKK
jgi:outer membrane lipoprotein-sorting protein/peroxiredoxin